MIQVQEINAFSDNYIWCLFDENNNAVVIDPGCSNSVDAYLEKNSLNLLAILITHHHHDHIGGVESLKSKHNCEVYGYEKANFNFLDHQLADKQSFELLGMKFETIAVPGHTLDHIAYYTELDIPSDNAHTSKQNSLFCGDTLFSGGCGRLFEGTPTQMLASLNTLKKLPETTLVYCAHEYTLSNLKFAETLMPNNEDLKSYINSCQQKRKENKPTIPSKLGTELKINPFLRANDNEIYQSLLNDNLINKHSELSQFTAIRKAKDNF